MSKWANAIREAVRLDVERWGVPEGAGRDFVRRLDASPALAALAREGIDGRIRALLAASALRDVILDPVGLALARLVAAPSIDLQRKLTAAGVAPDLIAIATARAEAESKPRLRPGRKRSVRGDAIYQLDLALRADTEMATRERCRIVASICSDFFGPTTREDVRLVLKDARQRARRARKDGTETLGALLTATESASLEAGLSKDRDPATRRASRHDSGARGYLVRGKRE